MKQKTLFKLFIALLAFAVFVVSCQKGDAGPAGPAGAQGPQGATGSTGPKGDTGTANVIYSTWLNVNYAADTFRNSGVLDTAGFFATITALKLTSAILNSGEIKVYFNIGTTAVPNVVPLPYVDIVFNGISITPSFAVQKINLYTNAFVSTVTRTDGIHYQYRYILIPGAVPGFAASPVDWNDYNKVKAYLGLKD